MDIHAALSGPARTDYAGSKLAAWCAFVLTCFLMLSDFIDRRIVVSMLPAIKADWKLSDTELGALISVVPLTAGLLALPVAIVTDRRSRAKCIFVMAFVWSLATVACSIAANYTQLLRLRAVVGVGEAGYAAVGSAVLGGFYFVAHTCGYFKRILCGRSHRCSAWCCAQQGSNQAKCLAGDVCRCRSLRCGAGISLSFCPREQDGQPCAGYCRRIGRSRCASARWFDGQGTRSVQQSVSDIDLFRRRFPTLRSGDNLFVVAQLLQPILRIVDRSSRRQSRTYPHSERSRLDRLGLLGRLVQPQSCE